MSICCIDMETAINDELSYIVNYYWGHRDKPITPGLQTKGETIELLEFCPFCGDKLVPKPTEVCAEAIDEGGFFRKLRGSYIYLRLSESAVYHHGLDPNQIHGVCHNGNMCSVERDKKVVRMTARQFSAMYNTP